MSWPHINAPPSGTSASSTSAPPCNNSTNHSNGHLSQIPHGLHAHAYRNMRGVQTPQNTNHMTNIVPLCGITQRNNNSQNISTPSPDHSNNTNTLRTIPHTRETNIHTPNTGDTIIAFHSDDHILNTTPAPAGGLYNIDQTTTIASFSSLLSSDNTPSTDPSNNITITTIPHSRDNTTHITDTADTIIASHSDGHYTATIQTQHTSRGYYYT